MDYIIFYHSNDEGLAKGLMYVVFILGSDIDHRDNIGLNTETCELQSSDLQSKEIVIQNHVRI